MTDPQPSLDSGDSNQDDPDLPEERPGTEPVGEPAKASWRERLRPWRAPAVIVAIVAGVATVGVTVWAELREDTPSSISSESTTGTDRERGSTDAPAQTASGGTPDQNVASAPGVGTCLADAEDLGSVVACDTPHAAEVIGSAQECTTDSAIRYVGGAPDTDVLHRDVVTTVIEDRCVLSSGNQTVAVSLSKALDLDAGSALRECLNERTNEFVPCSEDHTGEVVARQDAESTEPLDCQARAGEYMGQNPAYDKFTVEEVSTDSARRCVVSPRVSNRWLDTSLRDLGSSQPSLRPMD